MWSSFRLSRGEFVRIAYRLGRSHATGVLTIRCRGHKPSLLVLRRGYLMTPDIDTLGRQASLHLEHIASLEDAQCTFDGGTAAYPPGAIQRQFSLARWARDHLERQVDAGRAHRLVSELAGVRLALRPELTPESTICDEVDARILQAMQVPRRLDQIWPLARTPRYRLLTFLHFLRGVGALELEGVAVTTTLTETPAHRLLGVAPSADREAVKRAYRRMARALHPDFHQQASAERRRDLERKLADVTTAYRELMGG